MQAADADLKTVGNGGFVQNSNGYDIRPYSDAALTTALTYELVYYDATTGKLEMHVKIPTLSHTVDTVIYLAFGDVSISTDGSSTGTWDSNFKGVYHMKDGTTLAVTDSSQSGNNGTNVGTATATAGEIDGAANLVASSVQYVDAGNNSSFDFTTGFTLSAWINVTSLADLNYAIWKGDTTAVSPNFGNLYNLVVLTNGKVETLVTNSARTNIYVKDSTTTLSTSTWYLISSAFDASTNSLYVLINGAVEGAAVTTSGNQATSTSAVQFGADHSGAGNYTNYANAKIDEVRLSDIARSSSWLLSDYNSQKASSTFITWGTKVQTSVIQFDAAANSGDQTATNTYSGSASWSGSNRMLAVDVSLLGAGVTVTSMTYGGAACTFIGSKSTVTSLGSVECWRICSSDPGAPGTGANTLVVNLSGSIEFSVEWVSYTGVNQSFPTEGYNSNQATNAGSATNASVAITSVANNCWIHAAVVANDTSITAGQTTRNNIPGVIGSGANEDNNAPVTPAGATTMTYTGMGITTTWAIGGYAIRPTTASGRTSNFFFMFQ